MKPASATATTNPFPGLRPFREEEEHLFFGRERQVDAMVNKLAERRFLAVVGTSGSGKSSLVSCGLRPALHQGRMASAGTSWRMAQFRPGNHPLAAMAQALAEDGVLFRNFEERGLPLVEIIDTTLRMSKRGLIDIVEQAALAKDVNVLVVVDQFEELFRYRQLADGIKEDSHGFSEEATAFVKLLLELQEQKDCPIYVVLTMRSDFLGDCTQFAGLAEAINAGLYLVPRLTPEERRDAIVNPIRVQGAEIEPVLVTRLVNDVGDNPDQLSILQHALNRTWANWQEKGGKGTLALRHYVDIGTMAHALDAHAEEAYAELAAAGQEPSRRQYICEKLFQAITDKATDGRGVRRPTTLGSLCALTEATESELKEVIEVFRHPSRSFLMPPSGENLTEEVIDISHESLMRVWKRLNQWADQEALSAQQYIRLAQTAKLYMDSKENLLQDPSLQLALDWRNTSKPNAKWALRYNHDFDYSMFFLDKSKDTWVKVQRKLKRNKQLLKTYSIIMTALFGVAGYATYSTINALRESQSAYRQTYSILSNTYLSSDPSNPLQSIIHGLAAFENTPKDERVESIAIGSSLKDAIQQDFEQVLVAKPTQSSEAIRSLAFLNKNEIATGSQNGVISVVNVSTGHSLSNPIQVSPSVKSNDVVNIVRVSKNTFVGAYKDGSLRLCNRFPLVCFKKVSAKQENLLSLTQFKKNRLVSGGTDGSLQLWDLNLERIGNKILPYPPTKENLSKTIQDSSALYLLPTKRGLLSIGLDGKLRLFDSSLTLIKERDLGRDRNQPVKVITATILGEDLIVSGDNSGFLQVWSSDLDKVGEEVPTKHKQVLNLLQLTDFTIMSGGEDGTLQTWFYLTSTARASEKKLSRLSPIGKRLQTDQTSITSLERSPDIDKGVIRIASGGYDGSIRIWDWEPPYSNVVGQGEVSVVTLTKNGERFQVDFNKGKLIHYDIHNQLQKHAINNFKDPIFSLIQLGGDHLVMGSDKGIIATYDLSLNSPISSVAPSNSPIYSLLLVDTNQETLISGRADGFLTLLGQKDASAVGSWEIKKSVNTGQGPIWSLAKLTTGPSPLIASGGDDGSIKVWTSALEPIGGLEFNTGQKAVYSILPINNVSFISSGQTRDLRLWRLDRQTNKFKEAGIRIATDSPIASMALMDDGTLKTADFKGIVRTINRSEIINAACKKIDSFVSVANKSTLSDAQIAAQKLCKSNDPVAGKSQLPTLMNWGRSFADYLRKTLTGFNLISHKAQRP